MRPHRTGRNEMESILMLLSSLILATTGAEAGDVAADLGMEFVTIPAGSFMMGSDAPYAFEDSRPVHSVRIESFEMMTTEVTQAAWEAVTGRTIEEQRDRAHPSRSLYGCGPSFPVHYIDWADCHDFIETLNRLDPQHTYRLPSEAEWEYACRAGTSTKYFWGDDGSPALMALYCWYAGNSRYALHPAGSLQPNPWGLYDMLGNAIELCEDLYHADYSGAPDDGSAWIEEDSYTFRISRGGSFDLGAGVCTSSNRFYEIPEEYQHYLGFRLARTANP